MMITFFCQLNLWKFNILNNAASDQREKLVPGLALGVLGNGRLNLVELEHEVPGIRTLLCLTVQIHL